MRSALVVLLLATAAPVAAQRADQTEAYEAARSGRIRSLGDILSRLRPDERRDFIGSEFSNGGRYRLKFMQRGEVRSVDVDARTGQVVDEERGGDRRDFTERRMREYNDERRQRYDDRRDEEPRAAEDRGDRREYNEERRERRGNGRGRRRD